MAAEASSTSPWPRLFSPRVHVDSPVVGVGRVRPPHEVSVIGPLYQADVVMWAVMGSSSRERKTSVR